jgi:hypothetical protein
MNDKTFQSATIGDAVHEPGADIFVVPKVRFFSGRQSTFIGDSGSSWHRMTAREKTLGATGYDRDTHEPHLGISIESVSNGLKRIEFDISRLNLKLGPAVPARLRQFWLERNGDFSPTQIRHLIRRAHFSDTFARFEVRTNDIAEWRYELESILSGPEAYELI